MIDQPTVAVIHATNRTKELLTRALREDGFVVECIPQLEQSNQYPDERYSCYVVEYDQSLSHKFEMQRKLAQRGIWQPVIFFAHDVEIFSALEAMRQGAFDFHVAPLNQSRLSESVRKAIRFSGDMRLRRHAYYRIEKRLDLLTPREREILDLVVTGEMTKHIAVRLGIRPKTVDVHRSRIVTKMNVASVAELVRMMFQYDSCGESIFHRSAELLADKSEMPPEVSSSNVRAVPNQRLALTATV